MKLADIRCIADITSYTWNEDICKHKLYTVDMNVVSYNTI